MAGNPQQQQANVRIGKTALRSVRKLERPKPLRLLNEQKQSESNEHGDELLQRIDYVVTHINNGNFDDTTASAIREMYVHLRTHGVQLETKFKDQLDRYFVSLRNASRENRLDRTSRLRLLEIIELRAAGWRYNENLTNYYKHRYQELDVQTPEIMGNLNSSSTPTTPTAIQTMNSNSSILFSPITAVVPPVQITSSLSPGEILKCSGKFSKPTKIPGKNYYKDEIIIRNSDSGKVMGIKGRRVHMIEEFSDTVISFQRVSQGAKDRLVQITGPGEESINRAKVLIEETIRRNASPVREKSEQDIYGSDSSLTSSNEDDISGGGGGGGMAPFRNTSGRKGQQLSHSLSMNDASIGEYQYTVTVGRDTLKISGCKLDLVRAAKLLLEEYFRNDIDRSRQDTIRQDNCAFFSTNSQRPLSDLYIEDANFGGGDEFVPMQHSPSSPDVRSHITNCNGYQTNEGIPGFQQISSSSSESEELTYKENESKKEEQSEDTNPDSPVTPKPMTCPSVTVIRQPLFPNSPKQAFEEVENSANMQVLCAKNRRAHFAKTTEMLEKPSESSTDSGSGYKGMTTSATEFEAAEPAQPRIVYTREFLLDCAKSPYCRVTPKDMPHIVREVPYLLKKTPDTFDPDAYQKQDFSSYHVFPVLRSSSTVMPDYDEDDLV